MSENGKQQVSLETWLAEKRFEIEAFAKYWRIEAKKDPVGFPDELWRGDWEEQLDLFAEKEIKE